MPAFDRNLQAYRQLCQPIREARAQAQAGGGEKARSLHRERGKLMARERIHRLLDPGSAFVEVGQLAGHQLYEDAVPAGAIVTGIGRVSGRLCMVMANDATVKGGTYYPITIRKQVRAQDIARENGLPCVYLVDSGGAFLPMQEDIFPDEHHFGRIFRNIAEMSALGLTQVAAVMGSCTAGGAYIPAMCDETIIVAGTGTIFLGGPQLVQAATGEIVDAQTLGGAEVHTRLSGVADHFAEDDLHALDLLRAILARPSRQRAMAAPLASRPPLYDPSEIGGVISANPKEPIRAEEVLARLLDGSEFVPYRDRFGPTLLCGTGHLHGWPVGVLINDGVLYSESALKAANFIELCCQSGTPLLFLHNINGFMVGRDYEAGGIAKHGAKMVNAVATSRVPKFSLLIGGSYGAGNFAMCGRAFGPRMMGMWPNARTSVMGGEQAATVLALVRQEQMRKQGQTMDDAELEAFKRPIRQHYEEHSHPLYAASRLWVDSVVLPEETRDWLGLGLAMAAAAPVQSTAFGVFRM
jgi:3-methylcrotonyl-CoA carboxylase beta subunit